MALSSGNEAAIPFFRRAVEIDPKFASRMRSWGFVQRLASPCWRPRALQKPGYCGIVSAIGRFYIDFTYDRHGTGNLEKAYQTLELWADLSSSRRRQRNPRGLLGGISSQDRPISNSD